MDLRVIFYFYFQIKHNTYLLRDIYRHRYLYFSNSIIFISRYSAFIVLIPIGVGGELLGQYIIQSLYANKWKYQVPSINITVGYRHLIILMMLITLQGNCIRKQM